MGEVPSPPSVMGQVVGQEDSEEKDGEGEDGEEEVVEEEEERPPPAVPPALPPAVPTVAVPPAVSPAVPTAVPSVSDTRTETPRTECARTLASYATNEKVAHIAKEEVAHIAKDGSYAARRQAEAKKRMRDNRKATAASIGRPSSILIVVVVVVVVLVSFLTFALRSAMWDNRRLGRASAQDQIAEGRPQSGEIHP